MSSVNLSEDYICMLVRQSDAIARLAQDESAFAAVVAVFEGGHHSARTDVVKSEQVSYCGGRASEEAEYRTAVCAVLSELSDQRQRLVGQIEILLGILKILAHDRDDNVSDLSFWRQHAADAIAEAEAILAASGDPDRDMRIADASAVRMPKIARRCRP